METGVGSNHIVVTSLTGKTIKKVEVTLGDWNSEAEPAVASLYATSGAVVLPDSLTSGNIVTINDVNATSLTLNVSSGNTAFPSMTVYYCDN